MITISFFCLFISSTLGAIAPTTNEYTHSVDLIDNDVYTVFWKYDDTTITFEVHAKTLGWVGFGLTPNGGMAGSDVTITWIKDGQTFFSDRHAVGNYEPVVDESQDWNLLSAEESGEYTIIKLSRKHVTGDDDDLCITTGTMRLIFAFNPNDPIGDSLDKHTMKGSKSVEMLSPPGDEHKLPDDAFAVDFVMTNGSIGSDTDTTYWCEAMKPPPFAVDKHHIIMIEPVIEEGHESFVHHMILHACENELTEEEVNNSHGESGPCYRGAGRTMDQCAVIYAGWAFGGGKIWFPEGTGIPFGGNGVPYLLRLEIHYDNPQLVPEVYDHSGFRLWATRTLGEDVGVFLAGSTVSQLVVVPPQSDGYLVQGMCHGGCLSEAMNASDDTQSINVFATVLHTHLAGYGVRLKHIRDGKELPYIDADNSYDFNFQSVRMLPTEVTIKKGDHFIVQCAYETKGREKITVGGLGTMEEMCLAYMYYYPKIKMSLCLSHPTSSQVSKFIQFEESITTACHVDPDEPFQTCEPYVTTPLKHAGETFRDVVKWIDWNPVRKDRLQKISTEGLQEFWCDSGTPLKYERRFESFPTITEEYKDTSDYSSCPSAFTKFDEKEVPIVNYTVVDGPINTILPLSNDYSHSVTLLSGDQFQVFWKYDNTTITFEVHAKTLGWVGFGLTPNGGMAGSDVTITWIKDGQTFFSDRHAVGNYEPVVDESQDWNLLSAEESGGYTIIKLSRKHVTGDDDDLCITSGTMRLVYAMNPNDPSSESGPLDMHTIKGSKSIQLLSPLSEEPRLPDNAFPVDVVMTKGYVFPDRDTTYWCEAILAPSLDYKHHAIMIEPLIEVGHEWLVHHMVLYACAGDVEREAVGFTGDCLNYASPHPMFGCKILIHAWAVGGGKYWLPENVGFPFGENGLPSMLRLEIHYDNPEYKSNIMDHSGLRIWLTPSVRPMDAGVMSVGTGARDFFIPPSSDNFHVHGICHTECLTMSIGKAGVSEIKAIGYMLHSHLAGIAVRVRHFRNGEELPPLAEDNSYDFNFQEVRQLDTQVVIRPGDHIVTECAYQTKERSNVTWGGEPTTSEMCNAFLIYYPMIPITSCISWPAQSQLDKVLAPDYKTTCINNGFPYCYVSEPEEFAGQSVKDVINQLTWNSQWKTKSQKLALDGEVQYYCDSTETRQPTYWKVGPVPKVTKTYVDNSQYSSCQSFFKDNPDTEILDNGATATFVSLTLLILLSFGTVLY